MRTLILVVFTVFALTLGYMAYWWMQPAGGVKGRKGEKGAGGEPALPLVKGSGADRAYGPGKNIWVKKYDEETAKLASRFKASDYATRNDGWTVVKQPRAQFFMKDGRAICVEGQTGEVIMEENHKKGMAALSQSRDTPNRGRLYGVTIYLYHDVDQPEAQLDEEFLKNKKKDQAPHLAMTITLNNASFDNQTFKIYSEAFGKGRNRVEADQVPVVLRGVDYDFDGRGLVIRWNERDRRLQLLEVAHGDKLTIKHPNAMMKKQEEGGVVAVEGMRGGGDEGMRSGGPLPLMLAAKAKSAVGEAINAAPAVAPAPTTRRTPRGVVPKPKITPNTDPPLYRANFHDDVHIVQGDELDIRAKKMMVDFLMRDQGDEEEGAPGGKGATTRATTRPDGKSAKRRATTLPTTQQVAAASASGTTQPTTRAVARRRTAAATQPVDDDDQVPVVITWTGKLVVEPLSVGQENPIKDGEAVVRLEGTPVVATQQGSTTYSGTLTYRTEDQAMLMTAMGPDKPVVMTDTKGSVVKTVRMDYYQPKRQAVLYGVSDAVFPQEDENGKPTAPMLAKWTKQCTLYFTGGQSQQGLTGGGMDVERAELDGDVYVDHPQLKMRSQALEMVFDTSKKSGATTQATTKPAAKGTTLPVVRPVSPRVAELDRELEAVRKTIAAKTAEIAALNEPLAKEANVQEALQRRAGELSALETKVALQGKALADLKAAGQETPRDVREEFERTRLSYADEKAKFEALQKNLVRAQDLEGERDALEKRAGELRKEWIAAGGTVPAPTTRGTMAKATSRPTTRPAMRSDLRNLVATGTVHCEMTDSAKKTQTIDCNRLTMQTATGPDGKLYPNTINADGEVHAVDPDQDLRSGHLAVTLRPSTRPTTRAVLAQGAATTQATTAPVASGGAFGSGSAELQSMVAHQNVVVISKDGTRTTADQLLVDNKDGRNNVKLLGQPYATIVDKKSTLTGPIIEIFPDLQRLEVVGAGNMKGTQQAEREGGVERPIDVTWQRGLSYDGKANTVDVTGKVVSVTKDAEGATNTATGERMRMVLVDAPPTTRPTTRAVATVQPTTQLAMAAGATTQASTKPSKGPSSGMASKNVKEVTFEENAEVSSVTLADDGTLLRRTHLTASTVRYDMAAKRMTVPVEGRMLVEDHRPTTQPAATGQNEPQPAAGKVGGAGPENNRGTTAFAWSKRFTYDDATRQAVMEGDLARPVRVVHRDDAATKEYQLTGETVTADMEEVATTQPAAAAANPQLAAGGGGATTKPATTKPSTKMQMKRVTATGHLLFTGPGAQIRALYMEFDPKTNWLLARGNERELVDFNIASQPGGPKLAEEVNYNTETGQVMAKRPQVRMGR